jgi:hypothetical protein
VVEEGGEMEDGTIEDERGEQQRPQHHQPSVAGQQKKLKLPDLKAALRKRGLVTGGNKAERAERLRRLGRNRAVP